MEMFDRMKTFTQMERATLLLRCGMGLLFVIGGVSKLSQLLDPAREAKIIASYWGASGYVNQFFIEYLFASGRFSEWGFLT